MEGDVIKNGVVTTTRPFQSTPSAWRETVCLPHMRHYKTISIHSLRMEGDAAVNNDFSAQLISIHSLRMEGDLEYLMDYLAQLMISIHSLRMEGDGA